MKLATLYLLILLILVMENLCLTVVYITICSISMIECNRSGFSRLESGVLKPVPVKLRAGKYSCFVTEQYLLAVNHAHRGSDQSQVRLQHSLPRVICGDIPICCTDI